MAEQFTNGASSTISHTGGYSLSDTSIVLASTAAFPTAAGTFHAIWESEIVKVTNNNTGTNTLTIVRGQEGTTATGHADGTTFTEVLTAAALAQFKTDTEQATLAPVSVNLSTDVSLAVDPTYTDIISTTASGTKFLIFAYVVGESASASTMRIKLQIDAVDKITQYGPSTGGNWAIVGNLLYVATGLSAGSHTFKIQGSYGGGTVTVNALSDAKQGAWLIVLPLP